MPQDLLHHSHLTVRLLDLLVHPRSRNRFLEDELQILWVADDAPLLLESEDGLIDHRAWLLGQADATFLSHLVNQVPVETDPKLAPSQLGPAIEEREFEREIRLRQERQ